MLLILKFNAKLSSLKRNTKKINKGLCRAKHDTTTACRQQKVEQVLIKNNKGQQTVDSI